jgi:hypothetical protein
VSTSKGPFSMILRKIDSGRSTIFKWHVFNIMSLMIDTWGLNGREGGIWEVDTWRADSRSEAEK